MSKQSQPDMLVRANDSFALDLLQKAHSEVPDRNIVVAPLPISLTFAALWDGTSDMESAKELVSAFHWDKDFATPMGGKMLLERFAKPKPYPKPRIPPPKLDPVLLRFLQAGKPEELWLSAAFIYRGQGSLSQDFIDKVTYDFGIPFRVVGERTPQTEVLAKNWDSSLPMPEILGSNDFWITSFMHLRTSWAGNTFVNSKREKDGFHLHSGDVVQAAFLKSEFSVYPYARTEQFEAVVLSCWEAKIILILPSADSSVEKLEVTYAKNPSLIESLLVPREGDVRIPPFHFSFDVDFKNALEKLGVRRIFETNTLLNMAPRMGGGILRGVAQKTEITVDENGIRADSGTIAQGVLGGVIAPQQQPFHMAMNRPFLFIIRDNVTGALLFAGAVMDPTQQ
jgi:serine protease inhibitor